jgi:salicylate hydroxylase
MVPSISSNGLEAPINVAVVGGGMGGLCLAIGLLKIPHIRVHVYEAASKFSEVGAGVALGPNAQRALHMIDPRIQQAFLSQVTQNISPEFENTWFEFRRGTGEGAGEILANIKNATGQSTVHRAKFLDELVKLVPSNIVSFGKRLQAVEERGLAKGVQIFFADGTSAAADCVIGADGIHSVVRKHLLGPDHDATKPRFTGTVAYRGLVPMEKARAKLGSEFTNNALLWCGEGGMVMTYPIDHGDTLNVVASRDGHKEWNSPTFVIPVKKEQCLGDFEGWAPKAVEVLEVSFPYFYDKKMALTLGM